MTEKHQICQFRFGDVIDAKIGPGGKKLVRCRLGLTDDECTQDKAEQCFRRTSYGGSKDRSVYPSRKPRKTKIS